MTTRAMAVLNWSATVLGALLLGACAATQEPATTAPAAAASTVAVADAGAERTAPASAAPNTPAEPAPGVRLVVEELGVQLVGVRLSANGYIVDVRYRVFDPEKAKPLLDRKVRPVLVDEATGKRFYVPQPPIVGSLRQTARNKVIHTDRNYFILFANPDKQLQPGSLVTLYVGNQKFDNLQVDAN
jgi:pyruvate/2-oxoglutarate dehydrogenase complex dihydrolipoamide acyltransferase (E2) component